MPKSDCELHQEFIPKKSHEIHLLLKITV